MARAQLKLVLPLIALLVVFAIGFGIGRITAIEGAEGDFQIHDANGQLFIFNRKTGQLWRQFWEYNYDNPISGLQPVSYYDAAASAMLREQLDAEKAKHQKLDPSNFPDQPAKPQIDFQPMAVPSAASPVVPRAKPAHP